MLVYDIPVDNAEEPVGRVAVAARENQDIPGLFQNVWVSTSGRCDVCIKSGGRNLECLI